MKFKKEMLLLYAITDNREGDSLYRRVEEALKGGATMIQLREKELDEESYIKKAALIRDLCHRYRVPLIIDDNLSVALKSGADGVHLGAEDMPVSKARELAGDDFIIGATAKTESRALAAEKEGADYLGVGAVFPSPTKKDAARVTPRQLCSICESVSVPVVAIGGIDEKNIWELRGLGAAGAAVISAVFGAPDICRAAASMKEKAKEVFDL